MKFADFINNKAINAGMEATDKEAVIRELVGGLVSSGGLKAGDKDDIIQAILKREELGTCLLYTSPSPRDKRQSRMPSSA